MANSGALRTATLVFLVGLFAVLSGFSGRAFAATISADVIALNALLTEWGSSASDLNWAGDPCLGSWTGVVCDASNTTVISLSLDGQNLKGRLPPEIGNLANLQVLELSVNSELGGNLPTQLGNLKDLRTLSLQWCNFTGELPREVGNLVHLDFLGVNGNNLVGELPDVLGNLQNLTWLDISQNEFSGPLPVSTSSSSGVGLDNMTSAMHFHFNNNSLSGPIPTEIFSLPNLIHLILDHNSFSGNIPPEVGNSKSLMIIRLDFNQLEGQIPSEFTQVSKLTDLNFRHNKLSGTITDLGNLTQLQALDVSENGFNSQEFPAWALTYTSLQTLSMRQSNIVGGVPPVAFNLPTIGTLDLRSNNLNGSLTFTGPVSSSLTSLILDDNEIDGFVGQPQLLGGGISNVAISLFNNPLCNNNFIAPKGLICNEFEAGSVQQSSTRDCTNECNKKTLNPKTCLCSYPLQLMVVLTAPSFPNLDNETRIAKLEAELASKITGLKDDYGVTLVANQVWIRSSSSSSDSRINLDILVFPVSGDMLSNQEQNNIIHMIRQHKFTLSDGPFNLPDDIKAGFAAVITLTITQIALISVGAAVAFLLLLGVLLYAVRQRRNSRRAENPFASWGEGGKDNKHGAAPKLKTARNFSLSELKAATNNWSELLGEGGYGKVYRGTLKNGDVVAIKRANKDSMQGLTEFKNELELLSRVHHRNLVDLVGFCYEAGEQALVYEFMSNGTFRERLYEIVDTPLPWKMRLDIILNSARGLAYLHDHASPPIIHGDIKSANILLNHKMLGKVADFGLSKPTSDDGEKVLYSDEIRGTRGYLDPEYFHTHIHTDKSDVFSFGVVMIEALTGKSPTHGGKDRTREFKTTLESGELVAVRPLLDPFVQGIPDNDLGPYISAALRCVEEYGEARPTMTEVVKELEAIADDSNPPRSGVHKIDMMGNKSPEVYSDTASLVYSSSSIDNNNKKEKGRKDSEGNSFQYSGAYGVTTTIHPK